MTGGGKIENKIAVLHIPHSGIKVTEEFVTGTGFSNEKLSQIAERVKERELDNVVLAFQEVVTVLNISILNKYSEIVLNPFTLPDKLYRVSKAGRKIRIRIV